MNTLYLTQRTGARILAAVALLSLIASLVPMQAFAANANYLISGSLTQNGLQVSASGVASADPYTGQGNAQFISISWNFIGNGSVWETLADHNTLNFIGGKGPNGVIANTNWSSAHTYPGAVRCWTRSGVPKSVKPSAR